MTTLQSTPSEPSVFPTVGKQDYYEWIAISAFSLITVACYVGGAAKLLNIIFPVGGTIVGLFLYLRNPILYNGFYWWIWFLVALVRRMVDYRSSYTEPSPILLTPFLLSIIILPTVINNLSKSIKEGGLPFVLPLVAILYSVFVGYLNEYPIQKIVIGSFNWLAPILYGYYIFYQWRLYPQLAKNMKRVFTMGTIFMGAYGIYQYIVVPEWDSFWIKSAEFIVAGEPIPMNLRVWSTMHSGEPFSSILTGMLLLNFMEQTFLVIPASILGYITFALTMVRSAWVGWAFGLLVLVFSAKPKLQFRIVTLIATFCLVVLPTFLASPIAENIIKRFSTFSNLEEDASAQGRQEMYKGSLDTYLSNVVGDGIHDFRADSTIFSLLGEMGWIGGILYLAGFSMVLFTALKTPKIERDNFMQISLAIITTCIIRAPVNSSFMAASGVLIWGFMGFFIAGKKYYQRQLSQPINTKFSADSSI
jgi:hypothetical protein